MGVIENQAKDLESGQEDKPSYAEARDPFSYEVLQKHWSDFARKKRDEGKESIYSLLNKKIELIGGNKAVLQISNAVEIDFLNQVKPELAAYIREKLNNGGVSIETKLIEDQKSSRPYTNKDRFIHMMEKNPTLNELQNKLGLDPEF